MINPLEKTVLIAAEKAQPVAESTLSLPALSIEIKSGNMTCLTGSQCSTLQAYMFILAGIEFPASGQINLFEKNSSMLSAEERRQLRLKIGFVLQGGPLLSILNGIENLKLAARYHQLAEEKIIDRKAKQLLSEVPYVADHTLLPAYMSKLQRRHLAIARALMLDPLVLFIDSPFEGLDYHDREIIANYLANIVKSKHIAIVVSCVDLFFVNKHADQIIFCDNRETLVFDSWREYSQSPQENLRLLFKQEHIKKDA